MRVFHNQLKGAQFQYMEWPVMESKNVCEDDLMNPNSFVKVFEWLT